jgi:parallel beta-helix repeat protein
MKRLFPLFFLVMLVAATMQSCKKKSDNKDYTTTLSFKPGQESEIIEAFLSIKDSTRILLTAGVYSFDNLSIAQVKHITIQGEGFDKTILDFKKQTEGGEGIRVTNVKQFMIDGMTIRDSKGDLLKITKSRDVTISNLHAIWSKADSTSGGYAIYPVMCKNVLIENCYTQGSSDAGIYVGQSDSAIVRSSRAAMNVAGCEIENTSHAQVYDNEFYNNTAGLLIFDLPGLSKRGGFVLAHDNNIHDNNFRNFAKAGSFGTSWGVGNASPGTGVIVLAASDINIANNRIIGNNSSAITLASGFAVDNKAAEKINANYFPVSKNIKIHDNKIEMGAAFPAPVYEHHIGKMLVAVEQQLNRLDPSRKNKRIPLIMYDGISSNLLTKLDLVNPDSLCIQQTGDNVFVNADFLNMTNPKNWHPNTNMAAYTCK